MILEELSKTFFYLTKKIVLNFMDIMNIDLGQRAYTDSDYV